MKTTTMNSQCHEYSVLSSKARPYRQVSQMLSGSTIFFYPKQPSNDPPFGVSSLDSREMKPEAVLSGREMLLMTASWRHRQVLNLIYTKILN